jgi:XTP/dITP diphosphohydrolase
MSSTGNEKRGRRTAVEAKKNIIVLATTNPGKAREIRASLGSRPLRILALADLGIRTSYPEKGTTFEQNARGKSLFYSQKSEFLTLAEDSGLAVEGLGWAPGIYSARFSGPRATDEKNIQKVLRLMKNAPRQERRAQFICCLVLSRRGRMIKKVTGRVRGTIAFEKKGERGFGYDPIFYYHPFRKTFGELMPLEKNRVSHRGRALGKMKQFLRAYLKNRPA